MLGVEAIHAAHLKSIDHFHFLLGYLADHAPRWCATLASTKEDFAAAWDGGLASASLEHSRALLVIAEEHSLVSECADGEG